MRLLRLPFNVWIWIGGVSTIGPHRRCVIADELRGGEGADEEGKGEPQEKGLEGLAAFEEEESERNEKRRD